MYIVCVCIVIYGSNGRVNVNTLSPTQISPLGKIMCISFHLIKIYVPQKRFTFIFSLEDSLHVHISKCTSKEPDTLIQVLLV